MTAKIAIAELTLDGDFAIRAVSSNKRRACRCQRLAWDCAHHDLVGLYTHVANETSCLVLWHRCDPCRFIQRQRPWLTPRDSTFPLTWRASLIIQLFKGKKGQNITFIIPGNNICPTKSHNFHLCRLHWNECVTCALSVPCTRAEGHGNRGPWVPSSPPLPPPHFVIRSICVASRTEVKHKDMSSSIYTVHRVISCWWFHLLCLWSCL